MKEYLPFIRKPKKEPEPLPLYIEAPPIPLKKEEPKEEAKTIVIIELF